MDYSNKSNSELLAILDDIVQKLAKENNETWVKSNDDTHRDFRAIKREIYGRFEKSST